MKLLAIAVTLLSSAAAGELRVERVFGPETETGRYKHPAAIAALRNGDLYLVYYGGTGEYAINTGVFGARLKKGETKWSRPRLIASDPFRSVGNGVVWQAPDEALWLYYVVRWGKTWSTSRIQAKISQDSGETWSDSFVVSEREGTMVRNQPVVLTTGEYLLPIYHETGHDTENVGPDSTSRFLRFNLKTGTWSESGIIQSKKGNIQPAVAQITPEHLIAYCRRGGGYRPVKDGYIVRAESRDGGRTWTEGIDSQFANPNSAIEFMKLQSGNLLLIFNDSMGSRTPLTAALSTDGDNSWPHRRNIGEEPKQSYAYPFAAQATDGRIHLVYTSDNRTAIYHAVFDEDWVRKSKGGNLP